MSISVVKDNPLTVQVGATGTITDESHLDVDDTDYPDSAITYAITTPPTKGALLKNGSPTSSFTQDDVDNDRISYHETTPSNSNTSDSFFFQASDPGGNQTATTAFQINITQPDMPVALSAPGSLTVYAGLNAAVNKVVVIDDNRNNDTYTVTITAGSGKLTAAGAGVSGSGTSALTITSSYPNLISTLNTLDYLNAASGRDQLTVSVTDQNDSTTDTKMVDVTVLPAGHFTSLDAFGTVNGTRAYGINNLDQIVGTSQSTGFLYSGGSYTLIQGTSASNPGSSTNPQGINDPGDIVGYFASFSFFGTTGFLYHNGSFSGPISQYAEGINNAQQIVGYTHDEGLHVCPIPITTHTSINRETSRTSAQREPRPTGSTTPDRSLAPSIKLSISRTASSTAMASFHSSTIRLAVLPPLAGSMTTGSSSATLRPQAAATGSPTTLRAASGRPSTFLARPQHSSTASTTPITLSAPTRTRSATCMDLSAMRRPRFQAQPATSMNGLCSMDSGRRARSPARIRQDRMSRQLRISPARAPATSSGRM